MGNPCADKLLKSSKPLHDRIKETAGNVEYDDNPKAWKDAARKLQSQNLDQLNNIYADNNVGGYKKIEAQPQEVTPSENVTPDTTPKGNTSNVGGEGEAKPLTNLLNTWKKDSSNIEHEHLEIALENAFGGDTSYYNQTARDFAEKNKKEAIDLIESSGLSLQDAKDIARGKGGSINQLVQIIKQSLSTPKAETPQNEGDLAGSKKDVTLQQTTKDANDIITGKKVFERFSPQEQRGFTEGGANHVEASIILGRSEGTGGKDNATPEAQENSIETFAKEKGIWTNNTTQNLTEKYGEPIAAGEEAIVWYDPKTGKVIKTQDTFQYENLQQKLDGITLHNTHSPEAPLKVLGYGRNEKGDFQVIVEQPFIKGEKLTPEEIKTHLESVGFKEDENGHFSNGETIIEDVHTGNAIKTPEGNIIIIDPIMRLNTPEQGYGGKRKINENKITEATTKDTKPIPQKTQKPIVGEVKENIQQSKEEIKPPQPPINKPPIEGKEEQGGEAVGITHADTEKMREDRKLPEYDKEAQTVEKWRAEASERIKKGELPALLAKMKRGEAVNEVEQMMMGQYIANLDAELTKNPTKENLLKLNEAIDLSDKAGGTLWGRSGRARQETFLPDDSLGTFLKEKEAAQGTSLTEEQVKTESVKYQELKAAKEKLEEQLIKEREQHAKDIAELGFNKARAKAKKEAKKSHEEYKAERKKSVEAAREALKKIRQDTSLKSTIPGIVELKAIAPHVKDFLQSLANEGIDKLDVAIAEIHAEFKDVIDGISNKNIFDIIGGEYDAKKEQTRNQKASNLRLVQREANLIKELAAARKGEEKATSEKQKTASNRRIDELKEKIKEVRRLRKEEGEPVEDVSVGEAERLDAEIDKLTKKAQRLSQDIKDKKYLEEKQQPKPFARSAKYKALQDRVIDLENKIRHERSKDEYSKRSTARKVFDKVMEVLGIRRLIQSAVDISVPFRQGATLISPRQIDVWAKGFKANLQSVFSPKRFERIMYEIRHDKDYHDAVKDGIVYNDLGSADPNLHNEDFRKSFIYKIPLVGDALGASNRSADAFLNVARYEMYKKMRDKLQKQGLTRESDPKAFSYMGNWVMSMTGRGNMTKALENPTARTILGNTFYGARLMASRFNMLNPVTYFDPRVPKQAKAEAMKDMAAFTGTLMLIGLSLMAAGGKVGLDPDDSDFLQVRFGKKKYDISGGLVNYVRTFLRVVKAGYTKATGTKYEGNKATGDAGMAVLNFFRNKLSPNTAYTTDAFFGKAYGQEFDPYEIAAIYPMYADDAVKAFKEEGLISLATVLLPNILGVGYGSFAAKGQIDDNIEDLLKRNLRSDEMNSEKMKNYNDGGRPVTNKEFNEFADKRDAEIEKDIKVFFKEGIDGTPYKDLTQDQVKDEISYIKSQATLQVKKEMFGEEEKTNSEKRDEKRLNKERQEKYKNN